MYKALCKPVLLIFLLVFSGTATCVAQTFDYALHPKLDFAIDDLKLELKIDPQEHLLEGRAEYGVTANIGGVDSLVLNAAHMDIENVQFDENPAQFRLENDSLFVGLSRASRKGQSYKLEITYKTKPVFGVHFEPSGTVWTSFLPLSTRHWLPVVDHPRVTFTTDITLTVPAGMTGLAPGEKVSEQIISVEEKRVQWKSRRPVPASAIWFAAGPFESEDATAGIKSIMVSGTGDPGSQIRQKLLKHTYQALNRVGDHLGVEYPFEMLNVVILDDHRWETKPYGAGVIYLFKNGGDFTAQLYRGIAAQYFGVYQREGQWSGAEAMNLHQTALLYSVFDTTATLASDSANPGAEVNPYKTFSAKRWNKWQRFYAAWRDTTWKEVVEQNIPALMRENGGIKSWHNYAEAWYRQSGQPWFHPPELVVEKDSAVSDSISYRVIYTYHEINGELTLSFHALGSVVTELVSLPLIQHTGGQADTLQVTFTGKEDSVLIHLDPAVSYVSIDASVKENLNLEEIKPIPFILNELRSADTPETKAAAARQLGRHSDNPDLQLAILDMLSREQAPGVRAALINSLGKITHGAAGTGQMFLDALKKDQAPVQKAAISALKHYRDNTQVTRALRSFALDTDSLTMFKLAVESLTATADSLSFSGFSQQVINQDSTGQRAIFVLKKLKGRGDNESIIKNLGILISDSYPYQVRSEALQMLAQIDKNKQRWENHIKDLLVDNDPRIRLLTVRAITNVEQLDGQSIFKERLLDEYDGRVFYEMQKPVDSGSSSSRK